MAAGAWRNNGHTPGPEDCFWGSVDAQIPRCETRRIEATWVTPIGNEFVEIIYQADDHLEIRGKSMYAYDASGRCESYTLHFVRGDFPDLGLM